MPQMTQTQSTIKPFCNSVTVIESPVEEQVHSGIVVPVNFDGKQDIRRAVVVNTAPCHCEVWAELRTGTVIYYRNGVQIGDVTVVNHDDIVAYEEE